ncbi:MAG: formate/nitrite transporter family protein [Actinomycetaceae bacterium]|nr:formate/nitrite transporter family protein [Actinomycetaceae bacterium]MDY6082418.1 formate/nitrite transporter family protein [Actinomycetaceae bacterium]
MLSVSDALHGQVEAGYHKACGYSSVWAFAVATMLAGAYIGIADVLMFCTVGPFSAEKSPITPLLSGLVFGVGLLLVVFAGGELATSAMMALPLSAMNKRISWARALGVILLILLGNLVGSVILAGLVAGTGVADLNTAGGAMLAGSVATKTSKSVVELFFRGIMCNVLVCLAIWGASRTSNDMAKIFYICFCLTAFVACGYEHVVANMTTLSLGIFEGAPAAQILPILKNLIVVGVGNFVGGCFFVAGSYNIIGHGEK